MMAFARKMLSVGISAAVFLVVWQLAVWAFALPSYMLPSPLKVGEALWRKWDFLISNAGVTALETVAGLLLGCLLGVLVAIAMSLSAPVRRFAMPAIIITQALPVFAIAPLLVLWFGFGIASKIIMAMLIIFFPVASAFYDGLTRTDPDLLDYARLTRASRLQTMLYFRIPAALPALSSGLRVSAVFAPIGAIVGEWVGSSAGLGFVMLQANARVQTDVVFAALVILAAMALILRFAVASATAAMVPWQPEQS
jgi:putative hydroxymethylpyrimidine transport system permease protein